MPGTDVVTSSRTISEHKRYPRSAFLRERLGDDPLGMFHPMRNVATNIEGRHGLISEDSWLFEPFVYHRLPEMHDRLRDTRLNVDNMSYEELLTLEERIGDVSMRLSEETILNSMKKHKYVTTETVAGVESCCICQEEYVIEDDIGKLTVGMIFTPIASDNG